MSILIDNRFGYGTWRQIVNERAKRISEEKERIRQQKALARKKKEEFVEAATIVGSVVGGQRPTYHNSYGSVSSLIGAIKCTQMTKQ